MCKLLFSLLLYGFVLVCCTGPALAQSSDAVPQNHAVRLEVPAQTPLRLYLTHRIWYRRDEPVQAKVAEPVWAFDRIVIPAGSIVDGKISSLQPVTAMRRVRAIAGGDFTPLKTAMISFTSITPPGHTPISIQTDSSAGLNTLYSPPRPSKKAQSGAKNSRISGAQHFLARQAQTQLNGRSYGFFDMIRGRNKREWLTDFAMSKLPYHPQWYRNRTRFDATLAQPLDFGTVQIPPNEVEALGAAVPPDALAQVRFLTRFSSGDSKVGDRISAVLSQPLFTSDHKLILPEGTHMDGKVTLSHPARMFHRGGKLRFSFDAVDTSQWAAFLDQDAAPAGTQLKRRSVQAQLVATAEDPNTVQVDQEGTAKATESKTRLLRPVIAGLVAAKSLDNDAGKQQTAQGAGSSNTGGLALGGFSGFGLLGLAVPKGPPELGAAFGFYGLAWSVYTNVIARGQEVAFQKNSTVAIRFGNSPEGHSRNR